MKLLPKEAEGWMWHRPWFASSRGRLQGRDPQPSPGPQLVMNWAAQQEVTRRQNRNHPLFPGPWKNFIFHKTGRQCQKGWEPLLERKGQLQGEALPWGGLDLRGCARPPLKGMVLASLGGHAGLRRGNRRPLFFSVLSSLLINHTPGHGP